MAGSKASWLARAKSEAEALRVAPQASRPWLRSPARPKPSSWQQPAGTGSAPWLRQASPPRPRMMPGSRPWRPRPPKASGTPSRTLLAFGPLDASGGTARTPVASARRACHLQTCRACSARRGTRNPGARRPAARRRTAPRPAAAAIASPGRQKARRSLPPPASRAPTRPQCSSMHRRACPAPGSSQGQCRMASTQRTVLQRSQFSPTPVSQRKPPRWSRSCGSPSGTNGWTRCPAGWKLGCTLSSGVRACRLPC
mmetsp:Transcript_121398/g.338863  ORF Transcript_121398/g.338863 Transcript_121398/m.338863 type:complete len:255 (+) Transcript_121398:1469-2233(+)